MKPHYIYTLVDPLDIFHVRYVGYSCDPFIRVQGHILEARTNPGKSYKINWINKLLAANRKPMVILVDRAESRIDVGYMEMTWIYAMWLEGHNLTNENDGGEGITFTPAIRNKLRLSALRRKENPLDHAIRVEAQNRLEVKTRKREAMNRYWSKRHSPETIEQLLDAEQELAALNDEDCPRTNPIRNDPSVNRPCLR